jgi:hypothetical protein
MNKIIFQITEYKLPNYVINSNIKQLIDYTFCIFNNDGMEEYIENNPIELFPDSLNLFKKLNYRHKTNFFQYYFLYLNGGIFLNCQCILLENINNIIKDYDFVCVFDNLKEIQLSNIFLFSKPKNEIILKLLQNVYNINIELLTIDVLLLNKNGYYIINDKNNSNDSIKIYKQELYDSIECKIFDENNREIIKYFHNPNDVIIPPNYIISERRLKDKKDMIIGITIDVPSDLNGLYSNGIIQNTLYLGELLLNIGYQVYFIYQSNCNVINKIINIDDRFKFIKLISLFDIDYDIMICMGFTLNEPMFKTLKYLKTKIILYKCGNSYIIDSEIILYNHNQENKNRLLYKDYTFCDVIWCIPQMMNTNKHYLEILCKIKCIEVPFIWSTTSINITKRITNKTDEELLYKKKKYIGEKIAIFEPNISIMKWAIPPLLISELAYRKSPKDISHVYITNASNMNSDSLKLIIQNLNLFEDKKMSVQARYNTLLFMSMFSSIAVSHQWENNLNYLYFDLAWMGWPIIHNASLCKDVGYYYEGFNYEEGANQLLEAIENHDKNKEKYIETNRTNINKYLSTNIDLQNKYIELIESLF